MKRRLYLRPQVFTMDNPLTLVRSYLSNAPKTQYISTASPYIICSLLPRHWRCNKSLPEPFIVLVLIPMEDGTKVTVTAASEDNLCGEVRNGIAQVNKQIAIFNDLRFVGKSGRGKNFHLTITIHSYPIHVATIKAAIKVTVDGPRDARQNKKDVGIINHPIGINPFMTSPSIPFLHFYPPYCTLPLSIPTVTTTSTPRPRKRSSTTSDYQSNSSPHRIWRPF